MKKYLGGAMGAYCAIALILFFVGPIIFAIIILAPKVDAGGIIIALYCVFCTILAAIMMHKFSLLFYSWGTFDEKGVHIKSLFSKNIEIEYAKCKSIGIGLYVHGV